MIIAWLCVSCAPAPPQASEDTIPTKAAVIVVPGYYGTKLVRAADGAEIWIDAWEALFRSRSLRLPLPGMGFDQAIDLRPDGILKKVTVIPLIYSVMGYGSLLEIVQQSLGENGKVVSFAYDWRLDLMDAVQNLGRVVEELRAEGAYPIAIVAHSMGDLISSYYLRYGTQELDQAVENWEGASKVDVVVMAGVPFLGSMTVFRNMQYGLRLGLNRSLLEQKAVSSFPASYYVLPASDADVLLTPERKPLTGMIRDEGNWTQYQWGLLEGARSLSSEIVERRAAYTASWLRRAGRFSARLLAPPKASSPVPLPLLYIAGKGHTTLTAGVWLREESSKTPNRLLFNEEHFQKHLPSMDSRMVSQDGDGTVTIQSSSLPLAYAYAFHVTMREAAVDHGDLVSDPVIEKEIVNYLAARKIGAGVAQ